MTRRGGVPRGSSRVFAPYERAILAQLIVDGASCAEVADTFGCPEARILSFCNNHSLPRPTTKARSFRYQTTYRSAHRPVRFREAWED